MSVGKPSAGFARRLLELFKREPISFRSGAPSRHNSHAMDRADLTFIEQLPCTTGSAVRRPLSDHDGPRTNGGAQVGVADNQMIDDHVATIRLGCFFAFSPVLFRLRPFEPPLGVRGDEMILHMRFLPHGGVEGHEYFAHADEGAQMGWDTASVSPEPAFAAAAQIAVVGMWSSSLCIDPL